MQRLVSSSRAAASSSSDHHHHHVIDIMQQQQQNTFSLYNRKGMWPWRRFRSSREKWCHVIHAIPLVLMFCIFVLWWFSYPVNLEIKDGRLIAARKIEVPPQHVNKTRIDYTILMKQGIITPPPDPTPINETISYVPPNPTLINDTSAEPPVQPN